ncbi:MAG: sulfatase-like hydrolase/transferase, partial [Pirellulales bacterium]
LIISDDQAWTDFGFMGHPVIETPHLDRLARQSMVFPHGYVPSSLCRPSLASIITGLLPHQHKITGNDPSPSQGPQDRARYLADREAMLQYIDQVPTLPRMLAEQGYVSFQCGKWWEGNYRRGGFTHGMTHGDPKRGGRHGDEGLAIGRSGMEPIARFIESAGDRPFFIWYAPFMPHAPHTPPERTLAKYQDQTESIHVARYYAMCEWFDATCGELIDLVERAGQSDNTVVLFVVDNGWIQRPDSPRYAARSKRSPYDGGIRTPIMVHWPGHVRPEIVERPVSSIDLAPTILHACGLDTQADKLPGANLPDTAAVLARGTIEGACFTHNAIDIRRPAKNLRYGWTIQWPWKRIMPNLDNLPDSRSELFHLGSDPYERHNLVDKMDWESDALGRSR